MTDAFVPLDSNHDHDLVANCWDGCPGWPGVEPYSVSWKNHRQRLVVEGVRVDETTCAKCGQEWPCDVAQAFEAGYQRGLQQNDDT